MIPNRPNPYLSSFTTANKKAAIKFDWLSFLNFFEFLGYDRYPAFRRTRKKKGRG